MHGVAHDFCNGIASFKVIILKDKSYLCIADLINFACDIFAVDINFAFVLFIQTAYNVQKRRFARTGGADDGQRLALFQRERNILQHMGAAKPFADAGHFQQCHTRRPLT